MHEAELFTVEKLPGEHGIQVPSTVFLYVPARQSFMGKQNVDPGTSVVQPSKQEVQLTVPVEFE